MESKFAWTKQSKSQCQPCGLKITLHRQFGEVLEIINPNSHFPNEKLGFREGKTLIGDQIRGKSVKAGIRTAMSDTKGLVLFAAWFLLHSSNRQPALTQLLFQPGSRDPGDASSLETLKIPNLGLHRRQQSHSEGQEKGSVGQQAGCLCAAHVSVRLTAAGGWRGGQGPRGIQEHLA